MKPGKLGLRRVGGAREPWMGMEGGPDLLQEDGEGSQLGRLQTGRGGLRRSRPPVGQISNL